MSPPRATVPLLVALLASACGASTVTPAQSEAEVTPSPSPTASAASPEQATPEATPVPSGEVAELERGGPLPPGRYTRSGFTPTITFEVSGEWYAEQLFAGFFDVQQDVGSPDVIAVQFARPSSVFGEGGGSTSVTTAAEAADVLRGHPGLTVLDESESQLGGRQGVVLEVEHGGASAANVSLMMVPPGPLGIAPDRRLWVAFLDTDDGLLAVMVGGSVAKWGEALAAAEPVLESVTIGD
jgi:hypothetical protein